MATRAQKIRLALFFIASSALLMLFFIVVAGSHLLRKRDSFYIEFTGVAVSGLNKGAAVKYLGFNVGRIEDIAISPDDLAKVVVEISVERRKTQNAIRTDTEARMASLGITGLKYIELFGGSNRAAILTPGSSIAASETFFSNLQERAEILSSKIEQSIDRLNALLSSENQRIFTDMLRNAGDLMYTANELVQENRESVDETAVNIAITTRSLANASATMAVSADSLHALLVGAKLQQTVSDVQLTMQRLREHMDGPFPLLVARIDTMVRSIDRTFVGIDQTVGASRQNLLRAMQDLEETLQNVREATELIRDNPSVLIRGGSSGVAD